MPRPQGYDTDTAPLASWKPRYNRGITRFGRRKSLYEVLAVKQAQGKRAEG